MIRHRMAGPYLISSYLYNALTLLSQSVLLLTLAKRTMLRTEDLNMSYGKEQITRKRHRPSGKGRELGSGRVLCQDTN